MFSMNDNVIGKATGVLMSASLLFSTSVAFADDNSTNRDDTAIHNVSHGYGVTIAEADALSANSSDHVHRHMIFVLDVSDSVDEKEYKLLMDGIKQGLANSDVDYRTGFAFTTVRFASNAETGITHTVHSKEDSLRYISAELDDISDIPPNRIYELGGKTNLEAGITAVDRLLGQRTAVLGLTATRTSVIFIGDGQPNAGGKDLQGRINLLAQKFGATSYAVPVRDNGSNGKTDQTESARQFYQANLVTPAGFSYKSEVFGDYLVGVGQGAFEAAESFGDVQETVAWVMKIGEF